jgi:putative membrane protein
MCALYSRPSKPSVIMYMGWLFAFLHHVAAFTLVAALAAQAVLLADPLTMKTARRIQLADLTFGLSAGIVLIVGLLRVFYFEKGSAYYFHSPAFLTKFWLFAVVGLLSIYPTVEYLSWGKSLKLGLTPVMPPRKGRLIRWLIAVELLGITLIVLCAVLMARR